MAQRDPYSFNPYMMTEVPSVGGRSPVIRTSDANLTKLSQALVEVVLAGAQHLPPGYHVVISEGWVPKPPPSYKGPQHAKASQHYKSGLGAVDLAIYGPDNKLIPNRGKDETNMYTQLSQHVYGEMLVRHPELKNSLNWGGDFGITSGSDVADLMHFDLGARAGFSAKMAARGIVAGENYGTGEIDTSNVAVGAPAGGPPQVYPGRGDFAIAAATGQPPLPEAFTPPVDPAGKQLAEALGGGPAREPLAPAPAAAPASGAAPGGDPYAAAGRPALKYNATGHAQYQSLVDSAADANGVPREVARALVYNESGWDPNASAGKGDNLGQGIMQITPKTARSLGVDPFNPEEAIPAGIKYLADQNPERKPDGWGPAIGAYNGGPGNPQLGYGKQVMAYAAASPGDFAAALDTETATAEPATPISKVVKTSGGRETGPAGAGPGTMLYMPGLGSVMGKEAQARAIEAAKALGAAQGLKVLVGPDGDDKAGQRQFLKTNLGPGVKVISHSMGANRVMEAALAYEKAHPGELNGEDLSVYGPGNSSAAFKKAFPGATVEASAPGRHREQITDLARAARPGYPGVGQPVAAPAAPPLSPAEVGAGNAGLVPGAGIPSRAPVDTGPLSMSAWDKRLAEEAAQPMSPGYLGDPLYDVDRPVPEEPPALTPEEPGLRQPRPPSTWASMAAAPPVAAPAGVPPTVGMTAANSIAWANRIVDAAVKGDIPGAQNALRQAEAAGVLSSTLGHVDDRLKLRPHDALAAFDNVRDATGVDVPPGVREQVQAATTNPNHDWGASILKSAQEATEPIQAPDTVIPLPVARPTPPAAPAPAVATPAAPPAPAPAVAAAKAPPAANPEVAKHVASLTREFGRLDPNGIGVATSRFADAVTQLGIKDRDAAAAFAEDVMTQFTLKAAADPTLKANFQAAIADPSRFHIAKATEFSIAPTGLKIAGGFEQIAKVLTPEGIREEITKRAAPAVEQVKAATPAIKTAVTDFVKNNLPFNLGGGDTGGEVIKVSTAEPAAPAVATPAPTPSGQPIWGGFTSQPATPPPQVYAGGNAAPEAPRTSFFTNPTPSSMFNAGPGVPRETTSPAVVAQPPQPQPLYPTPAKDEGPATTNDPTPAPDASLTEALAAENVNPADIIGGGKDLSGLGPLFKTGDIPVSGMVIADPPAEVKPVKGGKGSIAGGGKVTSGGGGGSGGGFFSKPFSNPWSSSLAALDAAHMGHTPGSMLGWLSGQGYTMPNYSAGSGGSSMAYHPNTGSYIGVSGNKVDTGTYYDSQGNPHSYDMG